MKIKKSICAGLVMCVLFLCCSCINIKNQVDVPENTEPPIEEKTDISFLNVKLGDECFFEWDQENNVCSTVSWNTIKLSDEDEKNFPELKKTFDKLNAEQLDIAETVFADFKESAEMLGGDEDNTLNLEDETEVFVQRADSMIFSCLKEGFSYGGGAHPNYYYIGLNYDSATGEELLLTDVLKNTDSLAEILADKLHEKYTDGRLDAANIEYNLEGYNIEDYQWTMDYQGITFWFSPYDIAPYAAGAFSVKVYFDEGEEFFNEKYTNKFSGNYAIKLPFGMAFDFDLAEADEKKDCVELSTMPDEYGSYSMLNITVNGKTFTDEINYAYDFDAYLVHMGDENYIYSDSLTDGDYHMLSVFDINKEVPKQAEVLYGMSFGGELVGENIDDSVYYNDVFNNPDAFRIMKRIDVLGSRIGYATFKVGENGGLPEMLDEGYGFGDDNNYAVESIIPIDAKVLPDMTEEEFPAGTSFAPFLTDGETYVDLKIDDGRVVRLEFDISEWPREINGIPEEECFEGMIYAG